LLLSALNLWMMEYFFVLELLRPFLIFYFVTATDSPSSIQQRLRRSALLWAPYLGVFAANVLWREFIFNNQIYHTTLLDQLRVAPLAASWELVRTIAADLFKVSVAAWGQVFRFPNPAIDGPRTTLFYVAVVLLTGALVGFAFYSVRRQAAPDRSAILWMIGLGLVAMFMAGGPFWLTGLEITLAHPANRFTLPFMLGVSLVFAGILEYLPGRVWTVMIVLFVALAAGRQALSADEFARDWSAQKALFWQMYWRAPGIQPGTIVLLNQGPLRFYADNSLTGALNWIYDPGNRSGGMDYVLFYPTSRIGGSLKDLSAGQTVTYDFISEVFRGNTSQTLAFYYAPPGCLRLLDPVIDSDNHLIPDDSMMREAATLSSAQWITPGQEASMPSVYGPEPAHGWCYYFEQADLAAQVGDWPKVVDLGNSALQLNDHPNDPVERFVFIEGFAQDGNWSRVEELAMQSYKVSPHYVGPLLCKLIDRLNEEVPASEGRQTSLNDLRTKFSCLP
jgi:hypothetical protein